jgi:hypothetical protein
MAKTALKLSKDAITLASEAEKLKKKTSANRGRGAELIEASKKLKIDQAAFKKRRVEAEARLKALQKILALEKKKRDTESKGRKDRLVDTKREKEAAERKKAAEKATKLKESEAELARRSGRAGRDLTGGLKGITQGSASDELIKRANKVRGSLADGATSSEAEALASVLTSLLGTMTQSEKQNGKRVKLISDLIEKSRSLSDQLRTSEVTLSRQQRELDAVIKSQKNNKT